MRKIALFVGLPLALSLLAGAGFADGKGLSCGGHASFNLSGISMKTGPGEVLEGDFSKLATLSFGLDVLYRLNDAWGLLSGLQYDRLGGRYVEDHEYAGGVDHEDVKAGASFLTVPVLARYEHGLAGGLSIHALAGTFLSW